MAESRLAAGDRLAGRYRIDGELARGGMARIYRATDERLGRPVAIKVLAPPWADQPAAAERFGAEARTAAGISHPNLVSVYDSGHSEGVQFIVMELLDGYRSLRETLSAEGPLRPERAVELALGLLDGLGTVHARGLVHRDVKSRNVMLGRGRVKLVDFGISESAGQPAHRKEQLGSLAYMAPELLRGEAANARSDLYAAGVVLYEAITGRLPFDAADPESLLAAQQRGPVPPSRLATIPPRLDAALLQALDADPERRFGDAAAMAAALRAVDRLPDETTRLVPTAPPPMPDRRPGPRRRTPPPWRSALAGIGLGLLLAGALALAVMNLGGIGPAAPTPSATPAPAVGPGEVSVPNTIGMSEAEAVEAVRGTGLRYRIEWRVVPDASPGIYDQDPPAGTVVRRGSLLTMYAYRLPE